MLTYGPFLGLLLAVLLAIVTIRMTVRIKDERIEIGLSFLGINYYDLIIPFDEVTKIEIYQNHTNIFLYFKLCGSGRIWFIVPNGNHYLKIHRKTKIDFVSCDDYEDLLTMGVRYPNIKFIVHS